MRLRTKLLFFFTSSSAFIVLFFGGIMYNRLWDERLELIQESVSQQLRDFDFTLRSFFADVEGDVTALADDEAVCSRDDSRFTNFLQADESSFTYDYSELEKKIIRKFNTHRLTHQYVNSVYMGRENGTFVRSHPRERPTRYDPRERPWYVLAKSKPGEVLKTDAYPSLTTKDINIGVVKALVDESGLVFGVVGIDVTIANLTDYLLNFKVRPAGKIFLVDRDGVVLASQENGLRGKRIEEYSPALQSFLATGDTAVTSLDIKGRKNFVFHQKSNEQDWTIAVLAPASDIEKQIRGPVIWTTLGLSVGLLLLSTLTLYGLHLFVIHPIGKFVRKTDFITLTGNLDQSIDIVSRDEIGDLAKSYNNMVDTLRQSREEAQLSATRVHRLSKYANDFIILLDENLRFLEVNERVVDFYGYATEELIGVHASKLRAPHTKEELVKQIELARVSGKALYEAVHRRKDGAEFPVEISLRAIDGEGKRLYQAVIRDISERRETERALHESEQKYRELVENANSIILRWTHDGRITFLNEFGQRFFGYSAEEIIGRHVVGTIVPSLDSDEHDLHTLMDQICADPVAFEQNVNENMRRDGERVWIAWTNRIVQDEQGQVAEILSVGTDITERKRAEESIRELNTSLERRVIERTAELAVAKEHAEAADRLKSAFLATMSHELRTPLNSIIGFTGIILQELAGPINAEQRKQLDMVRDSSRHLLSLINDVLDISKIEAGQLEVHNEAFDVRVSIEKVVGIAKPLAEKKGLALRAELAPEIGAIVSDTRRVEQILLNLVNNAIKFTERGVITLSTAVVPGAIHISVADTGIGIKPEDMSKLFQPFRQIDSGLSRQHEGTGLGLAICRRLAELVGGEVNAESNWGKGSVFTLTLPGKGAAE